MATEPNIDGLKNINDLEKYKFVDANGEVAVRNVKAGDLLNGMVYDALTIAYPDSVTEIVSYRTGGKTGTIVRTIEIIYSDSTKNEAISIERTL